MVEERAMTQVEMDEKIVEAHAHAVYEEILEVRTRNGTFTETWEHRKSHYPDAYAYDLKRSRAVIAQLAAQGLEVCETGARERALREAAVVARKELGGYLCPYGRDKRGDPTWDHTDKDKCPVCGCNGETSLFGCHDTASGRIADAILALISQAEPATKQEATPAAEPSGETAGPWRCFHCNEVLLTKEAAREHFGADEITVTACQIDIAGYRRLEAEQAACRAECCEEAKRYWANEDDRRRALVAEEQKGYDRGLADGRSAPSPDVQDTVRESHEFRVLLDSFFHAYAMDGSTPPHVAAWIDKLSKLTYARGKQGVTEARAALAALKGA